MTRCLKAEGLLSYEVSACQLVCSGAVVRSSSLFWSKQSSVTQEFKLCFYSLSCNVSNHLSHSVLSLSPFATLIQKKTSVAQREAKSAPFLWPQTCSLQHWSAVSCARVVFNILSMWFHLFCNLNSSSGILLKINLCTTLQEFLMHFRAIIHHLHHFKHLISWHLRLGEIYCSQAVKFEPGNISWSLTEEHLSGPLNGLYFPSTLSAAGSNHDGIKITCGRVASSKQQLRDPLHSSINESLKSTCAMKTAPASQL